MQHELKIGQIIDVDMGGGKLEVKELFLSLHYLNVKSNKLLESFCGLLRFNPYAINEDSLHFAQTLIQHLSILYLKPL